jgi:hypothetical protein
MNVSKHVRHKTAGDTKETDEEVGHENSTDSLPDAPTRTFKRGVQTGQLISDINYSVSLKQTHKS